MKETEVAVIGGGILGCSTAYYLSSMGIQVTLLERGELAAEASGASTAGITQQNRPPEMFPLYREAVQLWSQLAADLGEQLGFRRCGSLLVSYGPDQFHELRDHVSRLRAAGLRCEIFPSRPLLEMAPWLSSDVAGGSHCPEDGFADPVQAVRELARAAERQGATLLAEHSVQGLERQSKGFLIRTDQGNFTAHKIVDAAGAWSGKIGEMLGLSLPVQGESLQGIVTRPALPWLDSVVLNFDRRLTLKQKPDGRLLIGGGWQGGVTNNPGEPSPENIQACLQIARASIPRLADIEIEGVRVGIEGRSPDRLPFFGETVGLPDFHLLSCAQGGFTLGPLLGQQLAHLIVTGRTALPMNRFKSRSMSAARHQ